MATIRVNKAIIWRNQVVFNCGITIGRRHITFNVDMPRADVPDKVEENILDFVQNYPNPQQFINADPWEGFEIEI